MDSRAWVVFDLDGTLVESEQIWHDVRRDFALAHGGRWTDDAQSVMIGMRTEEWSHYIRERLGVRLPESTIAREVVDGVVARVSQHVPILPGADDVLQRLSAAFTLSLATSATRAVADTVLEKAGWHRMFAVVVSADEVARGKPAPDVYLRALELLHADAPRAVAVEDSAAGIRSAHAARLRAIAIPNHAYPPDAAALSLAARVLPALALIDVETVRELLAAPLGDEPSDYIDVCRYT